jgi:succinyl-diaminopimelate desuccinylase
MDSTSLLSRIDDVALVSLTQEMVRIPSPNGQERALGEWLAARLSGMGLAVTVQDVHQGRLNVVAELPGRVGGPAGLLFHGHIDTVPVLGMPDPYGGHLVDGAIWGRGSVDQKGGLAAAIVAMSALAQAGSSLRKGVALAAVIDEESEHRGSYALVENGLRAEAAVVTEPSDLQLVIGHKGTVPARITLRGKQAHGSTPWLGVSAIEHAARVVDALGRLEPRSIEVSGVGMVRGTVNVGLIQGGTAYNNVPDRCDVWIDRRTVPGETQAGVLAEIGNLLDGLNKSLPDFKGSVEIDRPDWKWPLIRQRGLNPSATLGDIALTRALHEAHCQVIGSPPERAYHNGYLDMDFLVNDLAIPTVNYGPGEEALCHTLEERLGVAQLKAAARVYALTALALCG